jgi:ABC-type branched-subunit amino acid transport system substrate-binding protein
VDINLLRRPRRASIAIVVVCALAGTAAWSAGASAGTPKVRFRAPAGQTDGVSKDEIKVGGLVGIDNPVNLPYGEIYDGAQAYFDMVNAQGGVFGRKIVITSKRNDSSQPTRSLLQARALVEEDKVFALLPVSVLYFTGARYLAQKGVPAFGYHISNDWENHPNLFGGGGSASCFQCPDATYPWLAKKLGATKVGVIAYNVQISQDCARWEKLSYNKYGIKTPYVNKSLAFGFTLSAFKADVEQIRKSGIQLLNTCLDSNGSLLIKEALNDAGINIPVTWGDGYDQKFLARFGDKLTDLHLAVYEQAFEDPNPTKGMALFKQEIAKTGGQLDEITLTGWVAADLFVTGLRKVGKNLTRQKLIDALNKLRNFSAGGIIPPVDWTKAHKDDPTSTNCRSFITVKDGKFAPEFGVPGKPFVCLAGDAKSLDDFTNR